MADVVSKLQWFYVTLNLWDWWSLAAALVLLEAFWPSVWLLGIGCGAGLTGWIVMLVPALPGYWQFLIWGIASVAGVAFWFRRKRRGAWR